MTVAAAVDVLPRRMAGWAARRSLAPNALTGIGLACSLCAAVWFSAGSRADAVGGGLALCAGYLARWVCAQLVAARDAGEAVQGGVVVATLPMLAGFEAWLASMFAAAGELAVYAGLAVGARASEQRGTWLLAADAVITLSIRQVALLCQPDRGQPDRGQPAWGQQTQQTQGQQTQGQQTQGRQAQEAEYPPRSSLWVLAGRLLALPAGARTVMIALTAPLWGARITFLVLIIWGVVAVVGGIAQSAWTPSGAGSRLAGGAAVPVGIAGSRLAGGAAGPVGIAACRDDGRLARLAGRIVRGQLVPLPPALAGLAATVLLAALGLGNLPGILALAPVAAMLLAAPGAGHPHDGRLDWLVPLVLQATQYIYLAALGRSAGVPGPVTFGLICVLALRQLDLACRARQQPGWPARQGGQPAQRGGLGWDGRILVVGFGALLGIVTFAYLALTAYLGWLLCRVSLAGWLAVREGERR